MKRRNSDWLSCGLLGLVSFLTLQIVLRWADAEGIKAKRKGVCIFNNRQLGEAIMTYVQDYDGRLPYPATSFTSLILPYLGGDSRPFKCSWETSENASYAMNPNLQGLLLKDISKPDNVVLLYEGKEGSLNFRHDGSASVTFADGHAVMVTEAEAKAIIWQVTPPPNAKKNDKTEPKR